MAKKSLTFWLTKRTNYNDFSEEFSNTRKTPLPEFSLFEEILKKKKKILYIGCGNGRNIPLLTQNKAKVTGLDPSKKLLQEAKKNVNIQKEDISFVCGNAENIPFPEKTFDAVVAFASLHHITSKKKRERAFAEVYRVLMPEGIFLGTVWNLFQKRFAKNEQEARKRAFLLPWWNKNDFLIPWGQKKLPRLYYRFSPENLNTLLQKAGFTDKEICSQGENGEKKNPTEGKNICFIAHKK